MNQSIFAETYTNFFKKINHLWGIALLFLVWAAAAHQMPHYIVPGIQEVYAALKNLALEKKIWQITGPTIARVGIGFVVSSIAGIALGAILAKIDFLRKALYPILIILQTAPPISWIVLAIVWFGLGSTPPILVQIFTCVPIITLTTYQGIINVDKHYNELIQIYRIAFWDHIRYILLPAAMPTIFAGIRVSLGLSWRIVVTAEFFAANDGIGYYISWAHANMETDLTIAYTFFVIFLAMVSEYLILTPIEKYFKKWEQS